MKLAIPNDPLNLCIEENVTHLLNTRRACTEIEPVFAELTSSILFYGIDSYVQPIQEAIALTLQSHEKRIRKHPISYALHSCARHTTKCSLTACCLLHNPPISIVTATPVEPLGGCQSRAQLQRNYLSTTSPGRQLRDELR